MLAGDTVGKIHGKRMALEKALDCSSCGLRKNVREERIGQVGSSGIIVTILPLKRLVEAVSKAPNVPAQN